MSALLIRFCFTCCMVMIAVSVNAADNAPASALKAFIGAVQQKDAEKAFGLDYAQYQQSQGKFKDEIQQQKDAYRKLLAGNPSLCPVEEWQGVPCDSASSGGRYGGRSIALDVGLFIPKGSRYAVTDAVLTGSDKSSARLLVKIEYTADKFPVYAYNLQAKQIYSGIAPIPPMFSYDGGYVTNDNVFLGATECGKGTRFPFSFERKDISKAMLEFEARKVQNKWYISGIKIDKGKFE